jgi:predicted transcriptional regulator
MARDTSGGADARDVIQTLVQRSDLLGRLADDPASKRDLRDDLGVSRSTVYKAVRELEAENLVEQRDGSVRLTLSGRLLVERYRSFEGYVSSVRCQQSLLGALPSDAPVSHALLEGADRILAEPVAPDRPLNYLDDVIRGADRIVGFGPVALQRYVRLFHQQLGDGDLTAELVFERSVVDCLRRDYADRFRESLETDRYSLWVTDDPLPFGLVVAEGQRVAMTVYGEGGDAKGVIANDSEAALDWGRAVFERYRTNATRVEERIEE